MKIEITLLREIVIEELDLFLTIEVNSFISSTETEGSPKGEDMPKGEEGLKATEDRFGQVQCKTEALTKSARTELKKLFAKILDSIRMQA